MPPAPVPVPPPPAAASLREPQFEVIPLPRIADEVVAHLPPGARVTVTASPAQGLAATLTAAEELARRGIHAIPHLAARMLRDRREVEEVVARLAEAGVREVFVIAGDAPQPAGDLPGALELLEALSATVADPASGLAETAAAGGASTVGAAPGAGFTIGIGAHPEGHPFVGPAEAMRLLRAKAEHASYAVTQMCFEAEPLLAWIRDLRRAGIDLPVRPGIAVPVGAARLLRIGARIGVGRSLRLLSGEGSGPRRLLVPGQWSPGPLLTELEDAAAAHPELHLLGPHLYTFNALEAAGECLARAGP